MVLFPIDMTYTSPSPFTLIDLFSGAGGLTLGFTRLKDQARNSAFEPVWANDYDQDAAATYNMNFGEHCRHGDLVDLLEAGSVEIPSADVVIGGPPCQGFSLLNKNRSTDPRKQLWRPYMEVVRRSGAKLFVMENVRQILHSVELSEILDCAHEQGFKTTSALLCAADYGVPQERYRAFVIGSRMGDPSDFFPPEITHQDPNSIGLFKDDRLAPEPWRTVFDAISGLPDPVGTEIRDEPAPHDLHFGRNPTDKSKKRYRAVPPGGNRFDLQRNAPELTPKCWIRKKSGGTDLFGRLWWDRPSVTIRTEFYKPEKGRYLHPEKHRPISLREGARLQSFPDSFKFSGSKISIARQIGNAVPPLLAEAVARSVFRVLAEEQRSLGSDALCPAPNEATV